VSDAKTIYRRFTERSRREPSDTDGKPEG